MNRVLDFLIRRPVWTLLAWGVLLVSSVWLCFGLEPVLDVSGFLPRMEHPDAELRRSLASEFLETDRVLVVLESNTALRVEQAAPVIARLEQELRSIDGVREVRARLTGELRRYWQETVPRRFLLFLDRRKLRDLARRLDDGSVREGVARLRAARDVDPLRILSVFGSSAGPFGPRSPVRFDDGYMSDRNRQRYFVLVEPDPGVQGIAAEVRLVEAVDAALERVRVSQRGDLDARLYAVGRAQVHVETYRSWYRDARTGLWLSLLFVYLVFAACFRRPLAALAALVPIAVSIGGAVLVGTVLFGGLHLVSLVFCVLIVGLGIDFAFHIASHFWLAVRSDGSLDEPRARLGFAVTRPLRGILLGGLTTAVAFLALTASTYPVIRETGVVVAAGIALLLLSSCTLLPVVLYLWPARGPAAPAPGWAGLAAGLVGLQTSPALRRLGLFAWAAVAAAATLGVLELEFEHRPRELLARDNTALAGLEKLIGQVRVSFHPVVAISSGATREQALARDDAFFRRALAASRTAHIALVDSLASYLPPPEQQQGALRVIESRANVLDAERFRERYRAALAAEKIPADDYYHHRYPERIARVLDVERDPVTLASLRAEGLSHTIDRHLRQIGDTWYAATYLYPRRYAWSEGALAPLLEFWEGDQNQPDAPDLLLGAPLRAGAHVQAIRADTLRITAVAVIAVAVLLLVGLRSGLAALRTLIPVAVGAWLLAGFMGATGIEVHVMTLAVLPILFGIGVDDGAHVVARWRRGEALLGIFSEAGPGLVLTTLTTGLAFASLLFADNEGIRDFGLCGAVGVLLCLAASLHLLPLLKK